MPNLLSNKWIIVSIVTLLFIAFLSWLFTSSLKPIPGEKALQDGRTHVPEGSKVDYKFSPPTSGDHYPSWISKGFYDTPRLDGNLVHSLEHGYIIIWYDCERKVTGFRLQGTVYAQGIGMTAGSEGSPSATLESMPKAFSDGSCENLKKQIKDAVKQNGDHKLIAIPRIGMDYSIILTAWGRMEKLSSVDQKKIKEFTSAFRDLGPEHTNEP